MEFPAQVAHGRWPHPLEPRRAAFMSGRSAWLVHKIVKLALNLMCVLSAFGRAVALWIHPVQAFANLGLYLAAVNLAALAVFGRYELLVIAADDERNCTDATHLCVLIGTFAVAVTFGSPSPYNIFATYVMLSCVGALFDCRILRLPE